jgi:hypothetical protein
MPTSLTFPIESTVKNFHSPNADPVITNFFNNHGQIKMTPDNKSFYVSGGHAGSNGLEQTGTIYVGTQSVDNYAKRMDISPMWAARDLAIHELGHVKYQQHDYEINPGDNAPLSAKVDWCLTREAEATFFSFTVAKDVHDRGQSALHVPGTDAVPDLYNLMLSATTGIDPRSVMYEKKGIEFAKDLFSHDQKYVSFCSDPKNWKAPAYVAPVDNSGPDWGSHPGGSSGGGAHGGTGGYTPMPGGYWQKVPPANPSDSVAPLPEGHEPVQLVGIADHSAHFAHATFV